MDQQSANIQKIHEYISSLDKGQKQRKRVKYLIYVPLFLLLLVVSAFLAYFFYFASPDPFQRSAQADQLALQSFEQLNLTSVREHFQEDGEVLLVQLPESNEIVALNSEQEYWELVDQMALRFMDEEDLEEPINSNQALRFAEEPPLDTLNTEIVEAAITPEANMDFASIAESTRLLARGPKTAGNPMVFTIGNFQPDLDYQIDFGNGIDRKNLGRKFSYIYRRSGKFTAILTGYYEGQEVLNKKLFVSIKREPVEIADKDEPILTQVEPTVDRGADKVNTTPTPEAEVFEVIQEETPAKPIPGNSEAVKSLPPVQGSNQTDDVSQSESTLSQAVEQVAEITPTISTRAEEPSIAAPLMVASQMPSFPGGQPGMLEYLNARLNYPQPAQDFHIEGIVYVQFVVQADGSLEGHKVLKGLGYGCDEEALRITRSMPNWIPGRQNGSDVPVIMTLPVNFQLKK